MSAIPQEIRGAVAPPERISVSQWAERHRVLLGQTSSESGPWRNSRTPYLSAIMDAFSDPHLERIVLCKGSQLGGTEAIYNMLGYAIEQDPAPSMIVMPTVELARSVSSTRIQPMIDASPVLKDRKPIDGDDFTLLEMVFPGMVLALVGANSPASLASRPVRNVFIDECDKFPRFIGKEADPISLAQERQKTFWNKKTVIVSTPTTEDGQITTQLAACDVVYDFHVPCPHCGAMQVLRFAQIKWPETLDRRDPSYPLRVREAAWYECEECQGHVDNLHRPAMLQAGEWRPRKVDHHRYPDEGLVDKEPTQPRSVGFHLPSFYSPWLTWGDIAEVFVRAKDIPEKLMNVVNSWFAEPWAVKALDMKEDQILTLRNELPPGIAPSGTVALTAGFDLQKFGLWFTVWAWLVDTTAILILYGYIPDWEDVWDLLFDREYPIAGEEMRSLRIWRAALDTGGGESGEGWSRTEEAYDMLRRHGRGVLWGVRGLSRNTRPGQRVRHTILDKMTTVGGGSRLIPGGLILYLLATDELKEAFFWRLDNRKIQLHADTQEDFARQILSEEKRRNRAGHFEWKRIRKENHLLDASIYAHACADPQWAGGIPAVARARARSRAWARSQEQPVGGAKRPSFDPVAKLVTRHSGWLRR